MIVKYMINKSLNQQKYQCICYKVVKHLTSWPLNELVKPTMLWTTGPWFLQPSYHLIMMILLPNSFEIPPFITKLWPYMFHYSPCLSVDCDLELQASEVVLARDKLSLMSNYFQSQPCRTNYGPNTTNTRTDTHTHIGHRLNFLCSSSIFYKNHEFMIQSQFCDITKYRKICDSIYSKPIFLHCFFDTNFWCH